MELFVQGIKNKDIFYNSEGIPESLERWTYVHLTESDDVESILGSWIRSLNVISIVRSFLESFILEYTPEFFMNTLFVIVCCSDEHLGKVDKASFSQQTLMELLVQDLQKQQFFAKHENISQWMGLTFDALHDVKEVYWAHQRLQGTIHLEFLPSSLTHFNAINNGFRGTVPMDELPPGLQVFDVEGNMLSGTVNLTCLPESLTDLHLDYNRFVGTVCLTRLPIGMKKLTLSGNRFSGTVDVTCLPPFLEQLYLQQNEFEGRIDASRIPDSLQDIDIPVPHLSPGLAM